MTRALGIALLAVGLAGVALRLPAVTNPFMAEDLDQIAFLAKCEPNTYCFRNPLDLFRFFDGDAEVARTKMADGTLPWRCDGTQKAAFFRPLASSSKIGSQWKTMGTGKETSGDSILFAFCKALLPLLSHQS